MYATVPVANENLHQYNVGRPLYSGPYFAMFKTCLCAKFVAVLEGIHLSVVMLTNMSNTVQTSLSVYITCHVCVLVSDFGPNGVES